MKIKAEKLGGLPIWGVYDNTDIRIDFYYRKTETQDGLTKEELKEILDKEK